MDYELLKLVWWMLIGILLIAFAITGGLDLGVAFWLPILGKKEEDRRLMLNSIGPTWEGNQVWFVTAGGALFAAWPILYATAFSGLYFALLLVLFALILRPPGFDYRSKISCPRWRAMWDKALFISGFIPALLFGVAFGNLFLGLPFHFDDTLRSFHTGSFFNLLHPFALLAGVTSLAMLAMQGALFIQLKTPEPLGSRAHKAVQASALVFALAFALGGYWLVSLTGYHIQSIADTNTLLSPIHKVVKAIPGAWLNNFIQHPQLYLLPVGAFFSTMLAVLFSAYRYPFTALLCSSTTIACTIGTAGVSLFPFILPSRSMPNHSLTLWDAVSTQMTLKWMLVATCIFLPLILMYTTWVYRVVRGKITPADLVKPEAY